MITQLRIIFYAQFPLSQTPITSKLRTVAISVTKVYIVSIYVYSDLSLIKILLV